MNKILCTTILTLLSTLFFPLHSNAMQIKEGEWSVTMTMQMDGKMADDMANAQKEMENMSEEDKAMMQEMMGNMGMKMGGTNGNGMTISRTQCITNDNPVPKQEDQENCQETHSSSGNKITFEVTCKDSHSTGEVEYANDSLTGMVESTLNHEGRKEMAKIDIKGQYLGPCKNQ